VPFKPDVLLGQNAYQHNCHIIFIRVCYVLVFIMGDSAAFLWSAL